MKKLSFFLMAMLFSVMSFAAEATFDFSAQSYANQTAMNTVQVNDDVTITFAGGGNSNVPKYYTSGTAVRMYPKNSFTVTTTTGKLTSIVITFGASDGTLSIASNVGNYASGTWTGEDTSVTLTVNPSATSGNRRIKAITVTYGEVADNYVAAPAISGDVDFIESTEVSIAAGEGLKVYYTVDGNDPTNASAEYTAPFEVTTTTTVKAIAYNGENASEVASQTFTKATEVTCAEAKEIALKVSGNNVPTELTYVVKGYVTNIVGSWSSGKQSFWIADTKDGGNVFEAYLCFISKAVTLGDYVQLFGKLTKYNSTPEMANGQATILPEPAPEPVMFTVTATAENGTVEGAGEYEEGKEATLTATPAEGYEFVNWTSGETEVSTANPFTFTVTSDTTLVANFKEVEPVKLYLNAKDWGYGDARFAAYFFDPEKWVDMTKVEGEAYIYEVEVPAGYTKVIFVRMNGSTTENNWSNKWNQTGNLDIPTDGKNMFKPDDWEGKTTTWSTYTPSVKYTFTQGSTWYIDFSAITGKKGANYPKADAADIDYSATAGGTVIPVTFTADVTWAEGATFIKTEEGGWDALTFTTPTEGANCAQVAADGKSYTWTTYTPASEVTTITATFDLTQEKDTRDQFGTYNIYAGDYTLRIYGYNGAGTYQDDPTTEEDAAPILFTPDYEDPLDAVVVVTIDEENNKEVMQVTATSADGKKIYNLTINIALPSYETFNYAAMGVTAVPETEEGFTTYALEGDFDNEGTPLPFELYATTEPASVTGTIGEEFVLGEGENVAFFIEADNSFYLKAILKDEQGNIYNIEMMGTVAASQDVEIVVAKEENITLYNLNLEAQGGMAMVSAGNDALSFWLTLLPTENYYGGYMNDAFSNIWYGENQLYAAYGDMHMYGDNNGQVMFVVSFITEPDAEGNVTKYNFTLYPGDQPVDSKHTVTITVNPEGAGTVTGAGEYEDGAEVTVTAEENEGWYFMGWMDATTGNLLAEDYEYTFQALGDVNLIAYFIPALKGQSTDLVIGENTLTASTELSLGTLNMNLVLGEGAEGVYEITEESTLTIGDKAVTLMAGIAKVIPEDQMAAAIMIVEYNEELYYIEVLMVAPASGVDNINTNAAPRKVIRDGQLIIIKNGVEYNVQGAILK